MIERVLSLVDLTCSVDVPAAVIGYRSALLFYQQAAIASVLHTVIDSAMEGITDLRVALIRGSGHKAGDGDLGYYRVTLLVDLVLIVCCGVDLLHRCCVWGALDTDGVGNGTMCTSFPGVVTEATRQSERDRANNTAITNVVKGRY